MKTLDSAILSLGAGNMAHAILSGALSNGAVTSDRLAVFDPNADRRALFDHGFDDLADAAGWIKSNGDRRPLVLVAVKPQLLREALSPLVEEMRTHQCPACTFVSILAGSSTSTLQSLLREEDRVIRVMPNTPAQIGLGMTAIANDNSPNVDDMRRVRTLFDAVGEVIEIPEDLIDAFTAVAGSGPAYLFYLAEGMCKAAESIGFSPEQASRVVRQTILGSSHLLTQSSESPGDLRAKVTSKNGTTYAATTTLDDKGVMDAVIAALTAARDRGRELASE